MFKPNNSPSDGVDGDSSRVVEALADHNRPHAAVVLENFYPLGAAVGDVQVSAQVVVRHSLGRFQAPVGGLVVV